MTNSFDKLFISSSLFFSAFDESGTFSVISLTILSKELSWKPKFLISTFAPANVNNSGKVG